MRNSLNFSKTLLYLAALINTYETTLFCTFRFYLIPKSVSEISLSLEVSIINVNMNFQREIYPLELQNDRENSSTVEATLLDTSRFLRMIAKYILKFKIAEAFEKIYLILIFYILFTSFVR